MREFIVALYSSRPDTYPHTLCPNGNRGSQSPGLRIYGLEDPLRVSCASQRNADPPTTVAHRDHLITRHLVEVMLTDLSPVRVGGGFDPYKTIAGDARDHYTPIVCATTAMNQSVGFE